jgi:hypothetical protein
MLPKYFTLESCQLHFGILKLLQKPRVVFVEEADVVDAVTDHRDAFDAEAERPAGPDFRVVADVLEDLGVHHAAAGDLKPFLAHLARQRAAEVDLEAGLGVAEVVRSEANARFRSHQFLEDKLHCALEVADGDIAVHVKPFDLVEGGVMGGIGVVAAIDAPWHDDPHGWLLLGHHPNLDRGSVGAEEG